MTALLARMGGTVAALLALFALAAGALHVQYGRGHAAGLAEARQQLADDQAERQRESNRLAGQLVATARQDTEAARQTAARLQQENARVRKYLVPVAARPAVACAGVRVQPGADRPAGPDGDDAARRAPADAGAADLSAQLRGQPADGERLSADAVRVWNEALAAGRRPDGAAGACSAADPASSACAADSGVTLADAWGNHIENARRCAEDRANHRALIRFLQRRGAEPLPETHP